MTINSVIFAFGFRARSGKGTAVDEIIKQRGLLDPKATTLGGPQDRYDIRKYSFADALRTEVNNFIQKSGGVYNLLVANRPTHLVQANENFIELPEWVVLEENPEVSVQYPYGKHRTLYQWYGVEYRRSIDSEYWVRQLAQRIELEKPQLALIDDLRFPNEMQFCKQYGEVVRIDRDSLPPATHISETALADTSDEDWSLILDNNGSLEDFLLGAVTCFDKLLTNFPQQFATRALVSKVSN